MVWFSRRSSPAAAHLCRRAALGTRSAWPCMVRAIGEAGLRAWAGSTRKRPGVCWTRAWSVWRRSMPFGGTPLELEGGLGGLRPAAGRPSPGLLTVSDPAAAADRPWADGPADPQGRRDPVVGAGGHVVPVGRARVGLLQVQRHAPLALGRVPLGDGRPSANRRLKASARTVEVEVAATWAHPGRLRTRRPTPPQERSRGERKMRTSGRTCPTYSPSRPFPHVRVAPECRNGAGGLRTRSPSGQPLPVKTRLRRDDMGGACGGQATRFLFGD